MIAIVVVLAVFGAQSPQVDSLSELALRLPESALVVEARARPVQVREAIGIAFARSIRTAGETAMHLAAARRLAAAHAIAWEDSFLVRDVQRFEAWPVEARRIRVWVDSIRREGIAAFGRSGPGPAIALWKRALARAESIADTTGAAALLGNIGAGLLESGQHDSAARYLERAHHLAQAVGDLRVQANALTALGGLSEERGDLAVARERYARALALHERIGDSPGVAADRNNLGGLAFAVGDLDGAQRQYASALELNRREGRDEDAAINLLNLAGLASLDGDFARAERLYRDALATWRAHERWADVADAVHGLGKLEMRRGDYPAARAALREALDIHERSGSTVDALDVRRELAVVLAAMGQLQPAIAELQQAQRMADSTRVPLAVRAELALARADLALQLNVFTDAEHLYARAKVLFEQAGGRLGDAAAQQGLGVLMMERDDHAQAARLLEAARRTQLAAGDERSAAVTGLLLGEARLARGDSAGALETVARAARDLERLGDRVGAAAALGERATLEVAMGSTAKAESTYREAVRHLEGRVAPEVAWRLQYGLAMVQHARGATDDAARALRAALAEIDRSSRTLLLAERRTGFLADKWDVHARLAHVERERRRIGAAFQVSERLHAHAMLELLARGRIARPTDTAAELVAREQDLRRRIAELTEELERSAAGGEAVRGPDISRSVSSTREALLRTQDAYADLQLEIHERAPRHAALLSDQTATWRQVARRLASDEALIEYLVGDSATMGFVVTRDTIAVVDLDIGRRELSRLIEFARGTLDMRGSPRADSLWRAPLRRLHGRLIEPLETAGLLAGVGRLVVVPHAELHYLAFGALLDGARQDRPLGDRYELLLAPSASVWLALGERRRREPRGDPTSAVLALAPKSDALPAARREVAAIARLAGRDVRVLTGTAATEEAFRREAPTRRVLHLATLGVLNKHNPLFSFVELAPGGAHDGRLEVHEVFGLDLTADLVVLSACQTGLGSGALADVPAGDDWVGLTRAFLHAGAARVVATLWPVDDWATAALMERFYERVTAGDDPARALASAQRAMRAAPATAHPFYWAGFVVVGGANDQR